MKRGRVLGGKKGLSHADLGPVQFGNREETEERTKTTRGKRRDRGKKNGMVGGRQSGDTKMAKTRQYNFQKKDTTGAGAPDFESAHGKVMQGVNRRDKTQPGKRSGAAERIKKR